MRENDFWDSYSRHYVAITTRGHLTPRELRIANGYFKIGDGDKRTRILEKKPLTRAIISFIEANTSGDQSERSTLSPLPRQPDYGRKINSDSRRRLEPPGRDDQ